MIAMGIDPGMTGAIAVLGGGRREVWDMPVGDVTVGKTTRKRISPELLGFMLRNMMPVDLCVIEEVTSMPKQGLSSTFIFGQAHGLVLGAVAATGTRIIRVRPQEWQTKLKAKGDPRLRALEWQTKLKAKGDPRLRALQFYPAFADDLKRKKDEGRADAILLARYGIDHGGDDG
jgi:crossover junction endodeoxyribonuclease RuvC